MVGHFPIQKVLNVGHLNSFFGTGGQEFDHQKAKNSNARGDRQGGGGMVMLQIDRCITKIWKYKNTWHPIPTRSCTPKLGYLKVPIGSWTHNTNSALEPPLAVLRRQTSSLSNYTIYSEMTSVLRNNTPRKWGKESKNLSRAAASWCSLGLWGKQLWD